MPNNEEGQRLTRRGLLAAGPRAGLGLGFGSLALE